MPRYVQLDDRSDDDATRLCRRHGWIIRCCILIPGATVAVSAMCLLSLPWRSISDGLGNSRLQQLRRPRSGRSRILSLAGVAPRGIGNRLHQLGAYRGARPDGAQSIGQGIGPQRLHRATVWHKPRIALQAESADWGWLAGPDGVALTQAPKFEPLFGAVDTATRPEDAEWRNFSELLPLGMSDKVTRKDTKNYTAIRSMLDEVSGVDMSWNAEMLSNRAKFRQVPLNEKLVQRITRENLCVSAGKANRELQSKRRKEDKALKAAEAIRESYNRGKWNPRRKAAPKIDFKDYKVTSRYPLMGEVTGFNRELIGQGGRRNMKFTHGVTLEKNLPEAGDTPEVAFVGRSNSGKSSLINALTLTEKCRKSDKPGKTQSLNFYNLTNKLRIVDLPGYGFAFAREDRVSSWNQLMDRYLTGRPTLKRCYVIVDARHGLKQPDREMLGFLQKHGKVEIQVVLTKTDLVKSGELARRALVLREELAKTRRVTPRLNMVSTSTGAGVVELMNEVFSLATAKGQSLAEEAATGGKKSKPAKPAKSGQTPKSTSSPKRQFLDGSDIISPDAPGWEDFFTQEIIIEES